MRQISLKFAASIAVCIAGAGACFAQTPSQPLAVSNADNGWMLVSAALVLMMTGPGLALFYGGLVRRKNVLSARSLSE